MTTEISVVIATATGQDHLEDCLRAILEQEPGDYGYEVVVVIDGPNDTIHRIAADFQPKFDVAGVTMRIEQLDRRQGRFAARLHAAGVARHEQLLIVDDRNILAPGYINQLVALDIPVVIPSLSAVRSPTIISRTLNLIRMHAYKGWDGTTQESYWVDGTNFEQTSKTTGGLWVPREAFLGVSREIERKASNRAFVSDDTRLLRRLLDRGLPIFKSGEVQLVYKPRTRFGDEIRHLYGRGPLFIDYYARPGTRYFPMLVGAAALALGVLVAGIIWPRALLFAGVALIASVMLAAGLLSRRWSDFPKLIIGLVVVGAAFTAGLIRGLIARIPRPRASTES